MGLWSVEFSITDLKSGALNVDFSQIDAGGIGDLAFFKSEQLTKFWEPN